MSVRKARKSANEAYRNSQVEQLPADIRILLKDSESDQTDSLDLVDRISELEQEINVLSADNETLEAENRLFEEMKAQWQEGGFAAVISGKNEEIRALLTRVASESREKIKNLRSAEYWKAQALKLGWRRDPLDSEKT